MKIEQLALERYGIFSDRKLSFQPNAVLHVVLGANEAGKTSALSAIGDLLFGFGARTDQDFRHDSKMLRIGGTFRHSDGRTVSVRRRKGNKNTLVDDADRPLPDDFLAPILDGLSRDTFGREFGLTAAALREGGENLLKAGGRLAETLAAGSAGMSALSRLKDRLQTEADELFTTRRSGSKLFYLALDRRDMADKALRESIVTREALQQLNAAVEEARVHLETVTAAHGQSGGQLMRWQRTVRVRPQLARLESLYGDLAGYADLPQVSAQVRADWRAALAADVDLEREIASLDATDAAEAEEAAALAIDEALLAEGAGIDVLLRRLGAVEKEIEDLPRRRQARDGARVTLDDAARRLGLPGYAVLLERLPTDLALAHARDLTEHIKREEQALADARARRTRAEQELAEFAAADVNHSATVNVEHLRQRFDALGDIPAQADRLRRETAVLDNETNALLAAVAALDPTPGALERLASLPVPDGAAIARAAAAAKLGEDEAKGLRDAIVARDRAIADSEAELARLASVGAVPTRNDLAGARRERDTNLDALQTALDGGDSRARAAHFAEVVRTSQAVDGVTDLLLTDTGRAARQEDAERRLAESRRGRERDVAAYNLFQTQFAEANEAWVQTWAASGLTPRSPAEMLRWRERFDDIFDRLSQRNAHIAGIQALTSGLEAGKTAVIAFLAHVGRNSQPALSAEILFREAKSCLDELQAAAADAKARSVAKRRIERDLAEADLTRDAANTALTGLRAAWPAAMIGLALPGDATPAEAAAAWTVWQSVGVPKASYEREGRSVETMEADLRIFDADVFEVVERVAPELKSETAHESLLRLSAKLVTARSTSESCRRLRDAAERRATARNVLVARRASGQHVLDEAYKVLGVTDGANLFIQLERLKTRHNLEGEIDALKRALQEAADGLDEAALRQERSDLDLDSLPGEIERETVRQDQLLQEIKEASAALNQKRNELLALTNGRDATVAASARVEAGTELVSIAERWLVRAAASRLATRVIERHRARAQDPLVARASELFAMATASAFSGLGIVYGDDDQPLLVAVRAGGERVEVSGLSEGTRDQLFLALRLALLERRTSEPMPFIGDDLLTSFDETRTLATLRLLAAAGKETADYSVHASSTCGRTRQIS